MENVKARELKTDRTNDRIEIDKLSDEHLKLLEEIWFDDDGASTDIFFENIHQILQLNDPFGTQLCIAYFFAIMLQSPNPEQFMESFIKNVYQCIDSVRDNSKKETMFWNFQYAMRTLLGNYLIEIMGMFPDRKKYVECFFMVLKRGSELLGEFENLSR